MDWPHDPDSESGSGWRPKYGHAVLGKETDDYGDVPRSAGEYVETSGDHPVCINHEEVAGVAETSEHVDDGAVLEECSGFHAVVGDALREAEHCPYRTGSGGVQ